MGFKYLHEEKMKLQREATFNHFASRGQQLNDNELELACFKSLPFGHKLKGEFCISLSQLRWSFLYVEKDGIENYWFTKILRTLCTYRRVFLVGSASSGKTFGCSVAGMNFWASSPWNSTFLVTSTDAESLASKAWGTIRDLHDKDAFKIGVRVDYEDAITLGAKSKERDLRDAIKAIALPKGSEGEKAIGKVQGRKNVNIAWLCDEYAHMDPCVQQARSNLASAQSFQFWACSNKPEEGDPMYRDAAPDPAKYPLGWDTPGLSDMDMWETRGGGVCLYFDGEKSPNTLATGDKDPFPNLTRRDYIQAIRDEEGEDGYGWWKYIKSFPKAGEAHDKVINTKLLERHGALEDPVWNSIKPVVLAGLDPAWTKGGDDAMADFGRLGYDTQGTKILAHESDSVKLNAKVSGNGTFDEQIAEAFIAECQKRECHIVAIDISGSGGRIANEVRNAADRLSWKLEIITVDSAGAPDESEKYQMGDEWKNGKEAFDRRVSEVWMSYRLSIQNGLIRGVKTTAKATRELCERRSTNDERRRFVLEDKKAYKKRNSGKSPDAAESRVLCHFAARKHGLGAVAEGVRNQRKVEIPVDLPGRQPKGSYSWGSGKPRYAY